MKPLDIHFVRRQFPALESSTVFLDNAGGSQVLARVVDRTAEYLLHSNVQPGASYAVSQLATQRVQAGIQAAAELLGTEDLSEVVLGNSTTQLLANLALAMQSRLKSGDEIVVTNCDHESNIAPWLRLADRGVRVRFWNVRPETLSLQLQDLDTLLNERTRLVCVTQASNILGTIHPIAEIAARAHAAGAQVCVDGVAYAAHRAIDVRAWDCDYYAFSVYKVYGPHSAVLWGKRERLLELDNVNFEFIGRDAVPYKLQPGKFNFELAAGLPGIVDYLDELGRRTADPPAETVRGRIVQAFEAVAHHEERLAEPLMEFLAKQPGVRVIGSPLADRDVRVPTISFVAEGRSSGELVRALDPHGFGARFGHFYSKRLIDDLELARFGGVVRISMVHYNTLHEMHRLIRHLDAALDGKSKP